MINHFKKFIKDFVKVFKAIITVFKIAGLKKKARFHYGKINEYESGDAGFTLTGYIGYLNFHKREFNKYMDELAKLSKRTPNFRYKLEEEDENYEDQI